MGKLKGADNFKQDIYNKMTQNGYEQTFETFASRNSDPESADRLYGMLLRKGMYDGDLDQFKEQFYGVVKKKPTSETSASGSDASYVGSAGVTATGSSIEKANSGFQFVREGQEFTQGKKETTLAQVRQMKTERPKSTIVQVQDDKGRPTLRYLEDHKEVVKKKANRIPDAQTLDGLKASDAVLSYYDNKPEYVDMVEERRARGWDNTYNEGKFVAEGIGQMQRDVRSAIDIKTKEIGKTVLGQYLNLNEALKKTPDDSPEFPNLVADYQKFQEAHPGIQEYESLVNRFWALDKKTKEASKDPNYKEYFAVKAKKEQAQENADLWEMSGQAGLSKTSVLPATTKEVFDLGTGLVRASASLSRWVTGKKYGSLDAAVEWMERSLDPALNTFTATPSNRTQLVGQRYADVGNFRVLLEGDQVMGVVTREGGYQVRNQEKVDEVVKAFEQDKPEVKTQGLNPYTAHDVILGGTMQMAMGLGAGSIGAKLGKAGSIASNFGSKATTVAANAAGTYNKLYTSAIQELGPDNQKAAERYAGMAALGMSMLGTMINPLEQQLLGTATKTSIRALAKELGEGVAEQTAVRNATRMLLTAVKTIGKEGIVEGAAEAVLDDAIKFGINKTMLKDETNFDIDLPQDLLDNVAEETLGGLFGSVAASINPSQFQTESLENAYKSPNRAKIIAKLDKAAQKHYEAVFAKADLNPGKPIMEIHKQELVKTKTGEDYVAPVEKAPVQETETKVETTVEPGVNLAATIASQLDLTPGQEMTTAMGQKATVIGFDVDEDNEEAQSYYKVRMNESGEETLVSIADYNKRIFEEGVSQLQAEGMDRPTAEFAITAAQNLRGVNPTSTNPVVQPNQSSQADQSPEVGNMISDPIEENTRSEGYARDGITYNRQEPTTGVTGNTGKIEFSANRPQQEFRYKVVEADQIQPSHTNSGERNPLHFIPEAQPKERNDKAGMAASDAIAENIDLGRVAEAPNPFTGAPVVNTRGEVIQGNNRAIGIKKHYQGNKGEYKAQLAAKAQELGIDPTQVEAMNAPVLVREVDVNDEQAIELGNYDVKDLETGGKRRIDAVATSRRIPFDEKQKIASALLLDPDKTLRANIADNFLKVVKLLVPKYISPNQYDTIFSQRTNNITPAGIDDISELVLHFLFDGGDIRLRQIFDNLPSALQLGIINSMPKIFAVPQSESIVEQLQNAIILIHEVRSTKAANVAEYISQVDAFDTGKADRFSKVDIAFATLLEQKAGMQKPQSEVKNLFSEYTKLILGATDMFETRPGVSKAEAFSQMTGVPYSITPQDVINGTDSNVEPDATGETTGSQTEGRADARLGEETTSTQGNPAYRGGVQYTESKQVPPRLKGLYRVISNAQKAMSKFGDFKVYYYESADDIRDAYNESSTFKTNSNVNGFFNPKDNSIHIQVNADAASTTALHEILHPFVRAIKNGNPELFTQLHENLKTLPEYEAVTMTGSSVRQFSENPYYDFIGTTEEEALVEFFARVSSGELLLRKESKGKLIEWINGILRTIGFPEIGERADVRKWAGAIAQAFNRGIELDLAGVIDSEVSTERVTAQDMELARKLLGQAKANLRDSLGALAGKVTKALEKYGDVKVVFHDTNADIAAAHKAITGLDRKMTGFYHSAAKTIHVSLESNNPTHTLLHESLHVFMRSLDATQFDKLFNELIAIPEYTQALKTKGRSPKEHAAMYPERWQKEEALVEYFAAIASGEIPIKKDSKVIEILNKLMKLLGFDKVIDNTNVRFIAQGLATALREGIVIERYGNEVAPRLAATPFPYYDRVTKLVEIGINKGLGRAQIVQTIVNALSAEKITVDPAIIEAIHTSRTAIAKKQKPISNKYLAAFKAFHQKYFVAAGGGAIRDLVERLDGTIQRYVDHTQSLIALAEKQSKGIDQDLVDRFLRDENSAAEKSEIIDKLRILGFSEENIDQYMRRGTTRYQRSQMVAEYRTLLPTIQLGLDPSGAQVDQVFIDNTLESFVDSPMSDVDRTKVPADLASTLTTMRMQIDNLSQYLVDEGYAVGDRVDVIEQNLGQYMSDVYGMFKDKKFKPTEAAKAKARKYFAQQIRNDADKLAAIAATGNDIEEEILKLAAREVEDYIVKSQQGQSQGVGAPVGKKSEAIFKKKEGVPDELKDLLGKYEPLQEYAYTMFQLVSYVEKSKFQRSLADLGNGLFMWNQNDPTRPVDANYQLKGFASAKLSGDANPFKGMFVTREVFEVLNGLDQTLSKFDGIMKPFLKFQGWVNKFKTVYSYQTHFGNVIGNFFFMAFNGMADKQTISSIATAVKSTSRDFWGGYGLKQDEVDEALTILKNEGVIGNNISVMAIRETVGSLDKERAQGLPAKGQNALAIGDKKLTDLYQAEDSFFKILAYLTERKRYGQALYGKAYETLSPIERAEVNKIATDIAKANWPNYNRMGRFAQSVAKNNVIFGNFLPFTFEAIRTFGNTVALAKREIQSTNPGVRGIGRKRMAGIVAGSLAADALMIGASKVVGGVFALFFSGEDDTKLNRDLRIGVPKFLKGGDLMFTKVGPGVYQCIDVSAKNPMGIFRRHFNAIAYTPSDEEMATAVSKQFLESFFSETIAMKYVDSMRSNDNGKGDEIWKSTDSGTERAEKIFEFTLKAIGPASIQSVQKVMNAENPAITLRNQVLGMNTYELDFVKVWGKKLNEYNGFGEGVLSDLRQELNKVGRDEDATDVEYEQALKEFHAKRKVELDRLIEIRKSMLNVGLTEDQIDQVMKDARIGKEDQIYLNGGDFIEKYIQRKN